MTRLLQTFVATALLLGTLLVGSIGSKTGTPDTEGLLQDASGKTQRLGLPAEFRSGSVEKLGASGANDVVGSPPADSDYVPIGGAPPPDWLTPEMLEAVHQAATQGMAYDITSGSGIVPNTPAVLIRPGTLMLMPGICTMAFVYTLPFQPGLFIATAGHCTHNVGDRVVVLAAPSLLLEMGTTIITSGPSAGIGYDYALVEIDDLWEPFVSASMAGLGGPGCETQYNGNPGTSVKMWGQSILGTAVSVVGTPVFGTFTSYSGPRWDATMGGRGITGGDSGSAVIETADTNTLANCLMGHPIGIATHSVGGTSSHAAGTKANAHGLNAYRVAYDPVVETVVGVAIVPIGLALYAAGLVVQTAKDCASGDDASPCKPVIDCTELQPGTPCYDIYQCAMRQPGTICKAAYDLLVGTVLGCINNSPTSPCRPAWDCLNSVDTSPCEAVWDCVRLEAGPCPYYLGYAKDCAQFDPSSLCEHYRKLVVETYEKCLSGENPTCKAILDLVDGCLGNHPQTEASNPCTIVFSALEECLSGQTPACQTIQECLADGVDCGGAYRAIRQLIRDLCGEGGEDCIQDVEDLLDQVVAAVQQLIRNVCGVQGTNSCIQEVVALVATLVAAVNEIADNLCGGSTTDAESRSATGCAAVVLQLVGVIVVIVVEAGADAKETVSELLQSANSESSVELIESIRGLAR